MTDNPKDFILRARIDRKTLEKLDYSAKRFGTTRSEIVRNGIMKIYSELIISCGK